jgi:hypothetical protein
VSNPGNSSTAHLAIQRDLKSSAVLNALKRQFGITAERGSESRFGIEKSFIRWFSSYSGSEGNTNQYV